MGATLTHASVLVSGDYSHGAAELRRSTRYTMSSLNLAAGYSLSDRLTLELNAPLRRIATVTTFRDPGGGLVEGLADPHFPDETLLGLADIQTALRLRLAGTRPGPWLVDLRAGLYWPTGQIAGAASEAVADARHQPMFFGNGTIDPSLDVLVVRFEGEWRLAASGSLRAPLFRNDNGFGGPNLLGGTLSADRSVGTRKLRLALALAASTDAVGLFTFAGLSAYWLPALGWQIGVGVDVPLYIRGDEVDVSPDPAIRLSLTRAIGL